MTPIECDLCIVGAAPAARILASGLASSALRVVLLDPGVEDDHDGLRAFTPLSPADFSAQSGCARVAWPVACEELEPYFVHVRDRFELPMGIHDERVFVELPIDPPLFERDRMRSIVGHFAGGRPSGIASIVASEARVEVMRVDATVRIECTDDGGAVRRVEVGERTGSGARIRVEARAFVLASDAMTNARWLLGNREVHARGIGNEHGAVGRFATTRRAFVLGELGGRGRKRLRELHRRRATRNGFIVEPWLAVPGSRSNHGDARDVGVRFELLPRSGKQPHGEIGGESLASSPGLMIGTHRLFATGVVVEGPCEERVWEAASEAVSQPPAASSRSSLRHAAETLDREIRRLSLGACKRLPWLDVDTPGDKRALDFERPLAGEVFASTTRMSASPVDGVVDADGRVHGMANLYVAGASVLPALGWGDPLHPVAALTLRLEAHLLQMLSNQERRGPRVRT